jgi:hypothetical protein
MPTFIETCDDAYVNLDRVRHFYRKKEDNVSYLIAVTDDGQGARLLSRHRQGALAGDPGAGGLRSAHRSSATDRCPATTSRNTSTGARLSDGGWSRSRRCRSPSMTTRTVTCRRSCNPTERSSSRPRSGSRPSPRERMSPHPGMFSMFSPSIHRTNTSRVSKRKNIENIEDIEDIEGAAIDIARVS